MAVGGNGLSGSQRIGIVPLPMLASYEIPYGISHRGVSIKSPHVSGCVGEQWLVRMRGAR